MPVRPQSIEDLVEFLSELDASAPTRRDAQGRAVFEIRCKIPVVLDAPAGGFRFRTTELQAESVAVPNPDQRAMGDGGAVCEPEEDDEDRSILDRIEGPASSTSVDWYRTRMTRPALEQMAEQFKRGIDYLPRHHSFLNNVEWYDVMGRTVDARIERADVRAPAEGESQGDQLVLYTTTDLFADSEYSPKMLSRIRTGRPPGQSIGGWFTQVSVTYDDDGDVIYPIDIMGVDLDHLAAVRSPANPDADKVWLAVQRRLGELGQQIRALRTAPTPVVEPPGEPTPAAESSPPTPVLIDLPSGTAPAALSADCLEGLTIEGVLQHLGTFGQGAPAPAPEPEPNGRNVEIPMDEKELAELIARQVAAAMQPVMSEVQSLRAQVSAPAPTPAPTPEPAPAPTETAAERSLRLRAEQAEARIAALESEPQRVAARGTAAPTAAPVVVPVPEAFRIGRTGDIRSFAPSAARVLARAGDEISAREIPHLVWQRDGLGALSQLAEATGEAPSLTSLIRSCPELTADSSWIGPNGDDFGVFRGGLYPRKEQLRSRSDAELKALLLDVCKAADRDNLFA